MNCVLEDIEVKKYLMEMKEMLEEKETRVSICEHRDKNYTFYFLYNITKNYIIETLKSIQVKDFKYITENTNTNHPKNNLYVFSKKVDIVNAIGETCTLELYIKISIIKREKHIIIISFHEAEHSFK